MKVLAIPDIHFPFENKRAIKKVIQLIKKEKPTHIVQLGDLYDLYSFSRFDRSMNVMTPAQEVKKAVKLAKEFWIQVRKAAPRAKCYQLKGNHDVRFQRKLMARAPEFESIIDFDHLFKFPGVTTLKSDRDHLVLDGVTYCHGFLSKSEKHIGHYNTPVVHGHLHKLGITTKGSKLWSMDCGHVANTNALPLQYGASKVTNWCMGYGVIEDGKPRLGWL